ncbi:hypothetical protein [Staphylococcus pettenkoferi]|uniref:hypothetical protein n=1 Tax=Staphylococcus pettenkoferi TaxID=170573 RepID=UPI002552A8E0|nr:hypothetical protein [Staphylococcus pettenkoferi]MDK7284289.1 hypothetical protein [Staphylococcus pettenkoferi]
MRNSNDEKEVMDYEEAKKLRRDMLTIILGIIAIIVVVFVVVRFKQVHELKSEIHDKQEQKSDIKKHNKKIDEKKEHQLKEVGLKNVKEEMDNFNKLFFTWKSWGEYDKNMKELRQVYPKIDEGKKVDISGKVVGSGKSPESSYKNEYYTTTKKNEIAEKVTQSKEGASGKSSTTWYIVGEKGDKGQFNITHMKRYRELSSS